MIKDIKELEKLLGIELTEKQRRVFLRKEKFLMWGGSLSSGKSFLLAFMTIYYALKFDGAVCLIGRKFLASLAKTTQITLEILIRKLPKNFLKRHNKRESYYEFENGSRIYLVGLADSFESLDKIRGIELVFAAIDECQDLDDDSAFKLLSTRLRQRIKGARPRLLLTSNPTRKKWIRELFVDNQKGDFYFLKALPKDNPHIPPDYIKNQKKVLSEIEFKILILGSWEDAQIENCVFDKEKIEEAVKREKHIKGTVAYGIDVSLSGMTVMAKKSGNKITIPMVLKNSNIDEVMKKIGKVVKSRSMPTYVDSIGEGAGVAVVLEREKYNVIRVRQSEPASDYDKYFNQRAENYDRLNQMLDEGLNLPNDQELINQILMIKKEFSQDGRIKIESKKKLLDRKQSPDKLDAVVLACIGGGGIEDEEGEISPSYRQWQKLDQNLCKLEERMTLAERTVDLNNKEDLKTCERDLLPGWEKRRGEYDRLVKLYNRSTSAAWLIRYKHYGELKEFGELWLLKRPRENSFNQTYSLRSMGRGDIIDNEEDNPDVDVELYLEEENR